MRINDIHFSTDEFILSMNSYFRIYYDEGKVSRDIIDYNLDIAISYCRNFINNCRNIKDIPLLKELVYMTCLCLLISKDPDLSELLGISINPYDNEGKVDNVAIKTNGLTQDAKTRLYDMCGKYGIICKDLESRLFYIAPFKTNFGIDIPII